MRSAGRGSGRRGRLVAVVVVMLVAAGPAATRAGERPDLGTARRRAEHLAQRIDGARGAAERLQRRVLDLAERVRELTDALDGSQARLGAAQRATASARQRYEGLRASLADRAVEAFVTLAPANDLAYLLGADSPDDMADRMTMLAWVQSEDERLAAAVEAEATALAAEEADLEEEAARGVRLLADLAAHRARMVAAFAEQQRQLELLESAGREAESLVDRLERRLAMRTGALPFGRWAELLLERIEAPACRDNLIVTVAWQANEFTEARWNPLATTHDMPRATVFNEVGVRNFVSLAQGLRATEETLVGGAATYGYGAILDALGRCAPAFETAETIRASAWCRGCSGGAYVTGLVPIVEAYFDRYVDLHG